MRGSVVEGWVDSNQGFLSSRASHTHRHRNNGFDATPATTTQEILPAQPLQGIADAAGITVGDIPGNFLPLQPVGATSGLLQTTETSGAKAYSGIYYYPPDAAFNSMLFKDFVLGGMEGSYTFYLLANNEKAPSYKIYTFSPSTLQTYVCTHTPAPSAALCNRPMH